MNYYIITFTKAHYKITEEQKKEIMGIDFNHIEVEGCILKMNNIAEILSEDKYFIQYPDKRSSETYNCFEDNYGDIGNQQIRKPNERTGELVKQGFVNYFVKEKNKTKEEAEKRFKKFRLSNLTF